METKVCTKCGEEKPATTEFFYKKKGGRLGLQARCKVCHGATVKCYRKEHKEEIAEYNKRWREQNPEKVAEHRKRYYKEHKEEIAEYKKRYREEHSEKLRVNNARWYKNLPAAIYQIKNKETGKIYIGATTGFGHRRNSHKSCLRRGIHRNQALQEDYNKYGLDVFEFEVIEEHPCDTDFEVLEKIEEETIKRLLTEGKELYNTVLYSTR